VSSTSMDHLDELRVATASSLPLNGLAPRTYARDHATFEALSSQRGLIADWLAGRLSSSRIAPLTGPSEGSNRRLSGSRTRNSIRTRLQPKSCEAGSSPLKP
jgi:hypothetical protein